MALYIPCKKHRKEYALKSEACLVSPTLLVSITLAAVTVAKPPPILIRKKLPKIVKALQAQVDAPTAGFSYARFIAQLLNAPCSSTVIEWSMFSYR